MIISVTLSKPAKNIKDILGRDYLRIKIRAVNNSGKTSYYIESFTEKQAFHEQKTEAELNIFLEEHAGTTFKNCVIKTDTEETTVLANKKGKITRLTKPLIQGTLNKTSFNRSKNYLIPEGKPVPFMVLLGLMTPDGKVINSKYDKFRQINRFLEFINDILPEVQSTPLRIADFGCGKSYLTFAVHYFLTEIKKIDVDIIGLDLKKEVIDYCNKITDELKLKGLHFDTGNIADYSYTHNPDIVITLHACDTATDYALDYAVKHNCKAILSVPCCQHEINQQLNENYKAVAGTVFGSLLKYGIIKERFSALLTDALRADYLEKQNYSVQLLEFIDIEHTPKNILIRAVKKQSTCSSEKTAETSTADSLTQMLMLNPTLKKLLN